jgi:hypothetical protein
MLPGWRRAFSFQLSAISYQPVAISFVGLIAGFGAGLLTPPKQTVTHPGEWRGQETSHNRVAES